jgi:hypothetical protein
LRGEDAFTAATRELGLRGEGETVRKAYYRHHKRIGKHTYYISLLFCLPDYVAYLVYNEALLGW